MKEDVWLLVVVQAYEEGLYAVGPAVKLAEKEVLLLGLVTHLA
jgi:predicted HTH domain antitoxin